jgi:hypothetical protein
LVPLLITAQEETKKNAKEAIINLDIFNHNRRENVNSRLTLVKMN